MAYGYMRLFAASRDVSDVAKRLKVYSGYGGTTYVLFMFFYLNSLPSRKLIFLKIDFHIDYFPD